jgi:hypothetical protein
VSDQTVGNILRRRGAKPTWKDFIRRHIDVLAGTNFFTIEVLTWRGLVTYYVLFFIHLESRRVSIAGMTDHPEACWMRQVACNATFDGMGHLHGCCYLLQDRDTKFCPEFRETLAAGCVKCLQLPPRSPNLNALAERWVRSVKQECLSPDSKSIITKNAITKARTTLSFSPCGAGLRSVLRGSSDPGSRGSPHWVHPGAHGGWQGQQHKLSATRLVYRRYTQGTIRQVLGTEHFSSVFVQRVKASSRFPRTESGRPR